MADNGDRNIHMLPLAELTAGELHARGITRLGQSLAQAQDHVAGAVMAVQAQAFFFAALSARDSDVGAHRAADPEPPGAPGPGADEFTGHHS